MPILDPKRRALFQKIQAAKKGFVDWFKTTRLRPFEAADILGTERTALSNYLTGWGQKPSKEQYLVWLEKYAKFLEDQLREATQARDFMLLANCGRKMKEIDHKLKKSVVGALLTRSEIEQCRRFAGWLKSTKLMRTQFGIAADADYSRLTGRFSGSSRFQPGKFSEWLTTYEQFLCERRDDTENAKRSLTEQHPQS